KKLEILEAEYEKLPPETIEDGSIIDQAIVTNRMEELFSRLKHSPRKVITTIPNNDLIIRTIELPAMSENELEEALKWELEEILPYSIEDTVYDYLVTNKDEENTKILLTATKKEIINDYSHPLEEIGHPPDVINTQPMALISLLKYQKILDEPTAVVDMGADKTRVVLGDWNQIYLSRSIDNGGNAFTEALIEMESLEYRRAEEEKIKRGIIFEEEKDFAEEDISLMGLGNDQINIAREISEEINRSIEFYSIKNRGETINTIYLTGGTSKMKGIEQIIEEETDISPQRLNPLSGFEMNNININIKNHQLYSIVMGLAASEVLNNES
ncbi:MAG: type IV pilus assembly protein PilM, partial [Bacillota bacterium]